MQKIKEKKSEKAIQKKNTRPERKKKVDPLSEIEGNQKLNKLKKLQFKKEKKDRARKGTFALYFELVKNFKLI